MSAMGRPPGKLFISFNQDPKILFCKMLSFIRNKRSKCCHNDVINSINHRINSINDVINSINHSNTLNIFYKSINNKYIFIQIIGNSM